ncbi:hypothetical protein ACB094_07G090600 [Castanea mollissima]
MPPWRRKDPPFHSAWGTGVRVYTCSVVVGPTHPICSMIYGSTGATHFDQLAKILTGYEITGARSSGIFMGILFIAVGSLFKITAKNRLEVRGPLVPYPTPEPAAFALRKTALAPFLSPFRLLLCFVPIESKAKQKWEHTFFRFRVYGLDSPFVALPNERSHYQRARPTEVPKKPLFSNKEFRLGPGKRWQQQKGRGPCSCCARPLLSQWGSSREWSYGNSRLMENDFHPRRKPPSPSDSISLLTLYMWAPDIYEGSPTPVTAFLSIAPKISISANISRVSIYGSYGATLQQIFFFCSIASMILGALAAMAQTKVKRPLAHSSIGHVGYIRTGFSCGTIEGIQSLLIGIFIYALMTIDAFAIVLALRQTRVKYIADLGALAKTNPISAITFSITMFSYAGIPPLAGFCSKFYLFFAALGCGAYFLAPVGVVTSVIGRWAAGRLPRLTESVATRMGMHATKDRIESDTSTVYSISLYESTITTRDEPWFGELKLALGVIGLPVTARDRILRCSPPVVGTTRAGPGLDSER